METREADGTSVFMAPNIGFTTYCDSEGSQVLSSVAELVTAHELGHSWGAPHDPDTTECTPSAEAGGRYLMYTYAVPGYSPNNYVSFFLIGVSTRLLVQFLVCHTIGLCIY